MKKSVILTELQNNEEAEARNYTHYNTLGMEKEAQFHSDQSCKWDFLADLVMDSIAKEGDSDVITGESGDDEPESIPSFDPHADDTRYMPFDTDLGKGFM